MAKKQGKKNFIAICEKNAYITGIILSTIFAIIVSYGMSTILIDADFPNKSISTFELIMALFPIIFVVFVTFSAALIFILGFQNIKN